MKPRSLALRIAGAVAGLVLLASLLGFGLAYLGAVRMLEGQLDAELVEQGETLAEEARLFGAAGLRAAVEAQSLRAGPDGFALRLLQPDAEPIFAGRPFVAPEGLRGLAELPQAGGGALRGLGLELAGGSTLVVAADLANLQAAARGLAGWLLLGGTLTAAAVILAGLLLARGVERRLARLSTAAQAVMQGDLAQRLPLTGGGDELDRLAATMNAMLARIEALMAALRQVSSDVAHDLRSPLSRLRMRLEGRLAAPRDGVEDAAALEDALAELDTVLATFAALLRIAQAEGGGPRAAFRPLDLSTLVAGLAETYGAVVEEAGGRLEADVAPSQNLSGDAALLRQMLANLIENALTHGRPGGTIRLTLRPGWLEVADDGPGVPAAERGRVLDRFYRLDRSRRTPGTGLGLALVAAVARLHGGEVVLADARPGAVPPGLAVRVTLPR
ncbi:ATP-binding protein [Falsiroseomonas sp.]|uniref:sensor histidine kinase n=1 Tax=Falsiroseomonas sp. TaxID=2870721 RepID=UPI003F725D38